MGFRDWIGGKMARVLTKDRMVLGPPLSDFARICFEIRPCDVLLLEGRSRVSDVIKTITLSPWTHSVLYIGRLNAIEDPELRDRVENLYNGDPNEQLIIESLLGEGTIISPLKKYSKDHLRICRPKHLSPDDARKVTEYTINVLGSDYNMRQMLDMARFMLPYGIIPRHWRSSLFEHNPGDSTRTVCSTMIAEAFASIHYPILPNIRRTEEGTLKMYKCNSRLVTPRDFDFSPYFEIIKYPFMGDDLAIYRRLPWDKSGIIYDPKNDEVLAESNGREKDLKLET